MMRMGQWMLIKRFTDLCSGHCARPLGSVHSDGIQMRRKSKETSSQGHETEDVVVIDDH
jgi:hypothetical protein